MAMSARKLSPTRGHTLSPAPSPKSGGVLNFQIRKNSQPAGQNDPDPYPKQSQKKSAFLKTITLENVEFTGNTHQGNIQQPQTPNRSRQTFTPTNQGFSGAQSKNMQRPSNNKLTPSTPKLKDASSQEVHNLGQPKMVLGTQIGLAHDNEHGKNPESLNITKIGTKPTFSQRQPSQISKNRKVSLKQSQLSDSSHTSDGGRKSHSATPDKSCLNVKLPPVMQSTAHEANQPNQNTDQHLKETQQASGQAESARRSMKSSQELPIKTASEVSSPIMRIDGLRNSDQVETKHGGSITAPNTYPRSLHMTQVSARTNTSDVVEKGEFATKMSSGRTAKIPIPLTGQISRANTQDGKGKDNDQEVEDEDQSPSDMHEADFKSFIIEQMHLTPQTHKESAHDKNQDGTSHVPSSRKTTPDMPSSGVHNVTFMHQNHFTFPYDQYLMQNGVLPIHPDMSEQNQASQMREQKAAAQGDSNYDFVISTQSGQQGKNSSLIPASRYKFEPKRGSSVGASNRQSLHSKSARNKAQTGACYPLPIAGGPTTIQRFRTLLAEYANAEQMQIVFMKLWNLSHQCQDQLDEAFAAAKMKSRTTIGSPKAAWQQEPLKLISLRVLHHQAASFSMALLLVLGQGDLLRKQLNSIHMQNLECFDGVDKQLLKDLHSNFQLNPALLPLEKISKHILPQLRGASPEQKQKLLDKPCCSFDEFKALLLSVFGINLLKLAENKLDNENEEENNSTGLRQMNAILRYVFLVLTSKVSTQRGNRLVRVVCIQKLSQMMQLVKLECKGNASFARGLRQTRETFVFAMYAEPQFTDFKANFSEFQLELLSTRKKTHMEEAMQKYKKVLLNKVYDRENITYGSARDPMKIGIKKPRKQKEANEALTNEPKLAPKEGWQIYLFSIGNATDPQQAAPAPATTGVTSVNASQDSQMLRLSMQNKPNDEDQNSTIKVSQLISRPGTSNDNRFNHSFANLNSRLQRNVVSQKQKYRDNLTVKRKMAQAKYASSQNAVLLNADNDSAFKRESPDQPGLEFTDFVRSNPVSRVVTRPDGIMSGGESHRSLVYDGQSNSRPKSMNLTTRALAKRLDHGRVGSQPMSPTSPTSHVDSMKFDPQQFTSNVRPSTTAGAGSRRTNRIQLGQQMRQQSQPEIKENSKSRNYRTVVHSASSGTYAAKYKNSDADVQSKIGSLREADQAILNHITKSRQRGGRNNMKQNVQFSMPMPPQTVSGALTKEMYINKMGFDPLDQIASITSEQYDVVSTSAPQSAMTRYVQTLQNWSPDGRQDFFTLGAHPAPQSRQSVKFQAQNTATSNTGDGRFVRKRAQYGDILMQKSGLKEAYQIIMSEQQPYFSSRQTPDLTIDGKRPYEMKGEVKEPVKRATTGMNNAASKHAQRTRIQQMERENEQIYHDVQSLIPTGNKMKIDLPGQKAAKRIDHQQKLTGRFLEIKPTPVRPPKLQSYKLPSDYELSTNRLEAKSSNESTSFPVKQTRVITKEVAIKMDIRPFNQLGDSPGTGLARLQDHNGSIQKTTTLLLKQKTGGEEASSPGRIN